MISSHPPKPLLLQIDRWRGRLEELLGGLSRQITPEECHEIRESLARLATWMRLAGFLSLRERVKSLRRAVGAVRDLDVIRERVEKSDAEALGQERIRRTKTLRARLAGASTRVLLRDLRDIPAVNFDAAESETRHLARRVRKAGKAFVEKPTREHAHRLRRRLREYRFAREWLRRPTSPLKPLIRSLGRLNDDALVRKVRRDHGAEPDDSDGCAERDLEACRAKWKSVRRRIRNWSRRHEPSGRDG